MTVKTTPRKSDAITPSTSISAPGFESFSDVFDSLYPSFKRESQVQGSHQFTLMRVNQEGHEKFIPPVPDIVVRIVTDGPLKSSSVDLGDGRVELSGRKGSCYLAPADAGASWQSEGNHELLMLALPKTEVQELLLTDGAPSKDDPLRALYGRDIFNANLPSFLDGMWREGLRGGPGGALVVDGLVLTLLGTLARIAGEGQSPMSKGEGAALDAQRLARITDYVDANLEHTIVIRDLADLVGLSPFHFSRCFRVATSISPHKFVIARRIDASKRMLADPTAVLAQIAFACGFSSQSHFTTTFKEQVGMTPGAYRSTVLD
ncbi:MAG: AraC family transcriptional regulator [Pseudomonadota bacterium]